MESKDSAGDNASIIDGQSADTGTTTRQIHQIRTIRGHILRTKLPFGEINTDPKGNVVFFSGTPGAS